MNKGLKGFVLLWVSWNLVSMALSHASHVMYLSACPAVAARDIKKKSFSAENWHFPIPRRQDQAVSNNPHLLVCMKWQRLRATQG